MLPFGIRHRRALRLPFGRAISRVPAGHGKKYGLVRSRMKFLRYVRGAVRKRDLNARAKAVGDAKPVAMAISVTDNPEYMSMWREASRRIAR